MSKVCEGLKEYEQLEKFLMGASSIGIAAANIDDFISEEERKTLELSIISVSYNILTQNILNKILTIFKDKPSFNDAMKIINNVDKKYWVLFDDVIEAVLSIDDTNSDKKSAFRAAWKERYNSR